MKRRIRITVMALAFIMVAASGLAVKAQTIIKIYHAPGPSLQSPSSTAWLANWMTYLESGQGAGGNRTNNPTALVFDRLNASDLVESATTPLWLGVLNPANPNLAGERGNVTFFGVTVASQQPVRLADLQATLGSSDVFNGQPQNSLGLVQRLDGIDYSSRAVGIIWKDGVRGKPGATRVTSGSPTQLVNEIIFAGVAKSYVVTSQAELDNVRAYVNGQRLPFTITARYDLLADGQPLATAVQQWSVASLPAVAVSLAAAKSGNTVVITVRGSTNVSYTVQWAGDVGGPWMDCATVFNPTTGISTIQTPLAGKALFFR
jgi:hypothetical protein